MAKKKEQTQEIKDLKNHIQKGEVTIGFKTAEKALSSDSLQEIYLAKNCPQKISKEINHRAKLSGVPIKVLNMDNEELGIFCKKAHYISVLGIQKGE